MPGPDSEEMRSMNLGIVSGPPGWHIHDLVRAARESEVRCRLIDATKLSSSIACESDDALDADALLIRAFPSGTLEQTLFRLAALYRAERKGRLVLNSPAA